MSIYSPNQVLISLLKTHLAKLSEKEQLSPQSVKTAINAGVMVLLGNHKHKGVNPVLVGQPAGIKVNANIGTSPLQNCSENELKKLAAALEAGADTIMDLSIAGDLGKIRKQMLGACSKPVGTVPLYAVAQRYINNGKDPADIQPEEIIEEIQMQAEQGVDFMTVHCGLTERGARWANEEGGRLLGIVSRGGSILTRWMLKNKQENPMLTQYESILKIAAEYNVTLSLGDGLRPGAGADAGDAAQLEEIIMLGRLVKKSRKFGVQCMVEGPGHVPLNDVEPQIKQIKRACEGAPLYVLGPLTTDCCPGYDHIAGAIGAALAVKAGADFLCYLTPAEHLTLPSIADVKDGVMASRVAAQAGEAALGRPLALKREYAISCARKKLDWNAMQAAAIDPMIICSKRAEHSNEEVCAMCGDFCAVKMLRNN